MHPQPAARKQPRTQRATRIAASGVAAARRRRRTCITACRAAPVFRSRHTAHHVLLHACHNAHSTQLPLNTTHAWRTPAAPEYRAPPHDRPKPPCQRQQLLRQDGCAAGAAQSRAPPMHEACMCEGLQNQLLLADAAATGGCLRASERQPPSNGAHCSAAMQRRSRSAHRMNAGGQRASARTQQQHTNTARHHTRHKAWHTQPTTNHPSTQEVQPGRRCTLRLRPRCSICCFNIMHLTRGWQQLLQLRLH